VTFVSKAAQRKALDLNGSKVGKKGRYLKIDPAKAPAASTSVAPEDAVGMRRLFVKNLPYDATEAEVGNLFKACGKVREVRIPMNAGHSKGFAYVEFVKSDGLQAALSMQPPAALKGRTLRLDVDSGTGPKAGFHSRPEAYGSGFGPDAARKAKGKGDGKGGGKGGRGGGKPQKLSLF